MLTFGVADVAFCGAQRRFVTVATEADANTVYSIFADSTGLVWVGSNQGLYLYDGYRMHRRYTPGARDNTHIYCGVELDGKFWLGGNNGLHVYDIASDSYIEPHAPFPREIRAIALDGDDLLIGSLGGLYRYDIGGDSLTCISNGLPHNAVYAIAADKRRPGTFYIGTYNGLAVLSGSDKLHAIELGDGQRHLNLFVNSLLHDPRRDVLWAGTEGALYRLDAGNLSAGASQIAALRGNSVKSLAIDARGSLMIGTDNGLFALKDNHVEHYLHDSRVPASLTNNVVWSLFVDDRRGNVWAGTEYNISVSAGDNSCEELTLSELTGRGDGNRIHNIFVDNASNLWLGGTNGLIRYSLADGSSTWYKQDDATHPLPHNRVRDIKLDSRGDVWIATDGSINLYDRANNRFMTRLLTDSTHVYNANWAYGTLDDGNGHLWVGSYLGGMFVADIERLKKCDGTYVADKTYNTSSGMPCNYVNEFVADRRGKIWVALYQSGKIACIDPMSGTVSTYDIQRLTDASPDHIIASRQGGIWCAAGGKLVYVGGDGDNPQVYAIPSRRAFTTFAMCSVNDEIWLSTPVGVWSFDTHTRQFTLLPVPPRSYTAIYHDPNDDTVYLGDVDRIVRVSPRLKDSADTSSKLIISELTVNDTPWRADGMAPRFITSLNLAHDQNRLQLYFCDPGQTIDHRRQYEYRLSRHQSEWTLLDNDDNCITLANLTPGDYMLEIRPVGTNDGEVAMTLPIHVARPWYQTTPAIIVYALLFAALVVWIIMYMHIRQRLKHERLQRDQALESARSRMEMMSDISERLRTPLQQIIEPADKLSAEATDPAQRESISAIQSSAVAINDMIDGLADTKEQQPKAPVPDSADERTLAALSRLIEENLDDPDFNVARVSEKLGISSKQLYRLVKKHLDTTPVDYIKQMRLARAAVLLRQHKFTVSEVMYMVGFSSPGYFSKCFAAQYGDTPKAYAETSEN